MYSQGSHNPQPGQGPQKPTPSPALPHIQQGPSGFTSYQHGPYASHLIPSGGLSNSGQSYLLPPLHVHGVAPLQHMHPTAQQNSQHHSHLGTQNAHNMPQSVLPPANASHPEVLQSHPQLVDSSLRPSKSEPSEQPCNLVIVASSYSPNDSDMEMEDDITQIDDDQAMDHSLKAPNCQCDINDNVLHAEEQLHPLQISTECNTCKEEKESATGSKGLGEKGPEGITNAYQAKNSILSTEEPLVTTLEKSNTSSQPLKGGSPFRLPQGYASDDNSEKDVETCVGNTSVSFGERIGNKHISDASSLEVLQKENVMSSKEHSQEKNETLGSSQHKVDKFGRLVKNVDSDSDSDDSHHIGRHRRGRTRSRSQSFSPPDRRRRSPLKRREKRSRSRSWSPRKWRSRSRSPRNCRSRSRSPRNRRSRSRSPGNCRSRSRSPRNRRSRSRSPSIRRAGGFSSENKRRVKGQIQDCFDFRRGRCYRGASCRYLHHGSGKIDESRWQRSKQQNLEFPHSSRTNVHEEIKRISEKEAVLEHDGVRGPEVKLFNNFVVSTDMNMDQNRQYSVGRDAHNQDCQSTQYQKVKSENIPPTVFERHSFDIRQEGPNPVTNEKCQEAAESHQPSILDALSVGNMDTLNSCDNASQKIYTSSKNSVNQKSLSSPLNPVCQNADFLPQQSDNSSISNYSLDKPSTSSSNRLLERSANQNTMYSHNHPSHVPSHSLPHSQGLDNLHMKDQQTGSSVFQSSRESFPSSVLPNQLSHFALQLNPSLASLPPPLSVAPPHGSTFNSGNVTHAVSSHFPQSHLLQRNDSGSQIVPRPYPTELPSQSQSNGFQSQPYLQIQEADKPILHASLPVYNLPIQQFEAPSKSRDDGFKQPPMQNVTALNSFAQGNTQPHAMPFSHQMLGNKMQPFTGESLPPGGFSNTSSCVNSYSQQQQPPHSLHRPMVDAAYTLYEKVKSSLKDPPDIRDTTSNHVDIGGSTGSTFPIPYASTVDQPQSSKYSCDVLRQDTTYDKSPFSLTRIPVDGRGTMSQQATSSPGSARAIGQNFPISGGDQYDPILDSIEPSSRSSRKMDYTKKMEVTGDSDMLLGISGSNKPLDMEEENKRKDVEAVASAASADNEEFGETADAEVGAVENGSPSNPVATGEIEIDQIKSPGKSKKDKDSRSMKLFKVALADFVKEVLKPSWRQGNMSKEAFKTIVKKTVDKVSGAMKSHQIPKSRSKIDQYIESSQRKLTKLVMGYVDKDVNV